MAETTALKDHIDRAAIRKLGGQLQTAFAEFPLEKFVNASCRGLERLEFTGRTAHVAVALRNYLPPDIPTALRIINEALPPPLAPAEGMFATNSWLWPLSDFVRDYAAAHWHEAMLTCYGLTQCFTAEFAIRPLLLTQPDKTLVQLLRWTADPSAHVRRLCSEGSRPRLPWAARLDLPLAPVVQILESLKEDPSRFVQKSVANHLNDLGKNDPSWLLETMQGWSQSDHATTRWIVKHALRTQIKAGDERALGVIGYTPPAVRGASLVVVPNALFIGDSMVARLAMTNALQRPQRLLLDWVLHFVRPGRSPYAKVFKGTQLELAAGAAVVLEKRFAMQARATRRLFAGMHRLAVQANGKIIATAEFRLES